MPSAPGGRKISLAPRAMPAGFELRIEGVAEQAPELGTNAFDCRHPRRFARSNSALRELIDKVGANPSRQCWIVARPPTNKTRSFSMVSSGKLMWRTPSRSGVAGTMMILAPNRVMTGTTRAPFPASTWRALAIATSGPPACFSEGFTISRSSCRTATSFSMAAAGQPLAPFPPLAGPCEPRRVARPRACARRGKHRAFAS